MFTPAAISDPSRIGPCWLPAPAQAPIPLRIPATMRRKAASPNRSANHEIRRRIQAVAATSSLNRSAGVSHARVFRGRSLSKAAMASRSFWEQAERSLPFGKN